jgi:hypothetical protein
MNTLPWPGSATSWLRGWRDLHVEKSNAAFPPRRLCLYREFARVFLPTLTRRSDFHQVADLLWTMYQAAFEDHGIELEYC